MTRSEVEPILGKPVGDFLHDDNVHWTFYYDPPLSYESGRAGIQVIYSNDVVQSVQLYRDPK